MMYLGNIKRIFYKCQIPLDKPIPLCFIISTEEGKECLTSITFIFILAKVTHKVYPARDGKPWVTI